MSKVNLHLDFTFLSVFRFYFTNYYCFLVSYMNAYYYKHKNYLEIAVRKHCFVFKGQRYIERLQIQRSLWEWEGNIFLPILCHAHLWDPNQSWKATISGLWYHIHFIYNQSQCNFSIFVFAFFRKTTQKKLWMNSTCFIWPLINLTSSKHKMQWKFFLKYDKKKRSL